MDEIFYVTPNGYKISQSEALERYGDEGFDQLVNEGQLTEFVEEETPELNFQDGGHFYETPNGKVYSEGDLVNRYGVEEFKSYVEQGSLKKKDSPDFVSGFSDGTSSATTSPSPVSEEVDYFQGTFGDILRGIDAISPVGVGDFIDDMARSIDAGFQNGQIAESGNDLLMGGTSATYEDIQEFIAKSQKATQLGPSDEMQDYQRIYEEEGKGVWGTIKGLVLNPSVIPEVLASSFSAMANEDSAAAGGAVIAAGTAYGAGTGALAGGVGAAPGAVAGAAASLPYAFAAASTVLETGLTYGELLKERLEVQGKELTADNVKELLSNEEVVDELRFDAIARGMAIGTIDALTGRLGGKVAKPLLTKAGAAGTKSASRALKSKAIGRAMGVESVGGSIGETAGIAATNIYGEQGQEFDTGEILLEGIAEAPGSVKDLIAVRYQNPKYKINGKKATVEEIDKVIDGMTYEQLTAPNFKIQIDNDFEGRAQKLQDKILAGRTKESVMAANPDLNGPTVDAIVDLERQVQELEGRVLGTVTGKKKIADLKKQIVNLQENQLADEAAAETEQVVSDVAESVKSSIEEYNALSPDEKLELQDRAIEQMENEMAEQGIKEYELTSEMVDERASQILQQDIDNLEGNLEGETRFSVAEEGESAFVADPSNSEAITEEMNQMDEAEVNFTNPTGETTTTVNPFEDSNSSTNLNEDEINDLGFESQDDMVGTIEEFNGIPMITGVSDIAAGGTIKDSRGNDMNAKGGLMFNALAKVKAAWAGVAKKKSEDQYDNAVKLYQKNKDLFDRLWDEGRLPKGHIPMAIVRMGNDAVNSNELVYRYLSPEINAQSQENQRAALLELVSDLNNKAGKFGKTSRLIQFIEDKNINTLGQLMDEVVADANARAKGDVNNTLTLDERAELFGFITSPETTKTVQKSKDGSISNRMLNALYNGTDGKGAENFLAKNIYQAIGEPSMMKTKKGDVVSIVGIDVLDGGVIDIDHPNYGSGPKGRLIKLIKNPTSGMDVFPEWKVKSNRVFKRDVKGRLPSQKNVASQTMGTAPSDNAFQGASVQTEGITDMQQLAAKFRFAFPGVTVVATQQEFDAMLKEPGVRTKVSKGKTILGMTKDGKVFINPDQASLGTPIHEFGHIWIDFLRSKASGRKGTKLLERGLKLIEGTPELKAAIEKYGDNKLAREEALVEMMANKGETIVNASKKSRFKEWMNATFKYIKEKFTTLEGLKTKEIESMSLEDFINTGLADLFAGKAVDAKSKIKFDAAKESQGMMPRFSLGDDVAAFIKDARGQGISEVAIRTVLNRRGVAQEDIVVAFEKAGPKANQKSKVSEKFAKGFDRVMGEIDGIVEKVKARNTKDSTNPTKILNAALEYLKGTRLYKDSTDVQREKMIRELRKRFGQKEKKAPSAKRLMFGKINPKKITLTEKQALAEQIKSLNRGAKNAIQAFVEASRQLAEQIGDMAKKGKITPKQASAIIKRFTKVNMLSDASINSFVEYMRRVFNNANYAQEVAVANKQRKQALKNVRTKIGIADAINTQLNRIFSMKASLIPESVFQEYIDLVAEFGERKAILNPSAVAEVEKITERILEAVDVEYSKVPELQEKYSAFENKVVDKDGKVDYAKTIKAMLNDGIIDEIDLEVMQKYKSEILPKKQKVEKTEAEIEAERQEVIANIKKLPALKISELPSKFERKVAAMFESLINNIEAIENLSLEDLKQIDKLYNNINNGYTPHLVQVMNEKMDAQLKGKELADGISGSKLLPVTKMYAKFKSIFTRKGSVLEAIRRNPLFYVDQVFGNFKAKPIFNSLFNPSAKAKELFTSQFKRLRGKIDAAEAAVAKSFKQNPNKTLMSKFKQMVYMIQLEHDSNLGNPETRHQAAAYIKKTIEAIDTDKTTFSQQDSEMLAEILEKFTDKETGEINLEKLYNSFNEAEINSIKVIQEVNAELGPMAVQTASIIRGTGIKPRNNYVHLNVVTDRGLDPNSNESFIQQYMNGLRGSTKAKSLIKREGVVSALNFDVYASATRGAKGVLLDFHMTEPIRTARRTLNVAEKRLKGDKARMDSKEREKFNAIRDAYEEVVENMLTTAYQQTTIAEEAMNWLKKNGYRAILASSSRWIAELTSNAAFAMITNPVAFVKGSKFGVKFLNSDAAPKAMENLKSKQTNRIYPNEDMSGRMIDTNIMKQSEGIKGGRAMGRFKNKLVQVWNRSGKKYQSGVATLADGLISTPDKIVMRPMWFGSFASEFKKITGIEPDMDKIAANDSKYMADNAEALAKATEVADETSVMTGSTANPFLGILKGTRKPGDSGFKTAFNAFNTFMTTFLIYEFVTARTGIVNAIGRGHLSKRKGAALLAGSTTRMIMYTMMAQVLGEALASIAGEEEEPKDIEKKLGQAVASSMLGLIVGRDFGNATKAILNMGIEEFNKEFLDFLRDGEYDVYKDGLSYQVVPKSKDGRGSSLGDILTNMAASLGPAVKTADFIVKKATSAPKKTVEAQERQEDELMYRLPLELLGNSGFIPMYKDVRRLVLRSLYGEMNKKQAQERKAAAIEKEKLGSYSSRSEMKRYNYRLWYDTFGPNSPDYESEQQKKEQKRREAELNRLLKDKEMNYTSGSSFGSGSFGSGDTFGKKKRKKKGKDTFGSEKFGN